MSRYADGPLLAGVWRQVVVLPRRVEADFDEREVRLMLAHELAHCKRRDLAWNWLPALVSWLFYFHPLVWLMTRRWCEAQEVACDEMLIQGHVARPADYGRLLVKLAQHLPLERRATLAAAGVLGTYRSLERRIQAMSRVKPISIGRLTSVAAALTLIVLPATVPWRLVAQPTSGPALASGQEPQGGASPASLPGKIYTRVSLEFKTEAGVTETYTGIIAIDPNTGTWEKIGELGHRFQMSPDGARYLYCTFRQPANDSKTHVSDVWMVDAKGGAPERIAEDAICPHWSPNGKEVLYFKGKKSEDTGWRGPTWLFDLATKQARKLPVPETDEVDDWSREGNWLVTVSDRHNPQGSGYQLYVMHPDGTGERRLTEGGLNCYPQFSPDGKRIVYKRSTSPVGSLWVVDVDGSNRKQVMIENADGSDAPDHASWSPDGKWLAVMVFDWQTEEGKKEKFRTAGGGHDRIVIIMPDGTNKRLLELEGVSKTIWVEDPQWY
jgi:Tol biopolymer transport system component